MLDVAVTALLDDDEFGHKNLTFKPRALRRYKAVCLLLEHIFPKSSKKSSQELEPKMNWRMFRKLHHSMTEGLLFSKITDAEARRGLETLCYALGTRVLKKLSANYQRRRELTELVHPAVSDWWRRIFPGHKRACPCGVLPGPAHQSPGGVAALPPCTRFASTACNCRHRCHTLEKTVNSDNGRSGPLRVLEALPFVLPSTERIFPHLRQMRLLTQC